MNTNIFGFKIIPSPSWLAIPVYMAGYSVINMIMLFSRSGLSFSCLINVLGQQMLLSWEIGYITKT
jgi:hypothetical protein